MKIRLAAAAVALASGLMLGVAPAHADAVRPATTQVAVTPAGDQADSGIFCVWRIRMFCRWWLY